MEHHNRLTLQPAPIATDTAVVQPAITRAKLNRRSFLTVCAAAGGGLMLEIALPTRLRAATPGVDPALPAGKVTLVIGSDDSITLIVPGGEMGQGVNSALAQILAEELPLDFSRIKTVPAPYGAQYGTGANASQVTGGSWSVRSYFDYMLDAGATARSMLVAAAAVQMNRDAATLKAEAGFTDISGSWIPNGVVAPDGTRMSYGQLAGFAAATTTPVTRLSQGGKYNIIGTSQIRPDIREKVNGSAVFGLDVRLPGMVFAAVRHAPSIGASVATMGSAPAGMLAVNLGTAVAVSASNSWAAMKAVNALPVTWSALTTTQQGLTDTSTQTSNLSSLLSSSVAALAEQTPAGTTAATVVSTIKSQPKQLTLTYTFPMLAHASMEVLNCTVQINWADQAKTIIDSVNIWCPTQAPDWVAGTAASLTGVDKSKITVTTVYMGGAFGRKIEQDYVSQAVKVALAVKAPVKLMWAREEDFARDYCRPAAASKIQVGIGADGKIKGWYNRIAAPSVLRSHNFVSPTAPYSSFSDSIAVGSAIGTGDEPMPYANAMGQRVVDYVEQKTGFNIGFWRSVGQSISCFAVESAVDECAKLLGIDPLTYRQSLAAGNAAMLGVLNDVAALSNWSTAPAAGTARGIALSPGFGSHCAMVAEVSKLVSGTTTSYKVSRIFVSVDCGLAVNPDQVVSQIQGGVLQGMNAARWNRMQFDKGICQIKNFGDYKIGKIADAPEIVVRILNQGSALGGIGEVAVPPVAPALANAYAALTGTRKRALPLGF